MPQVRGASRRCIGTIACWNPANRYSSGRAAQDAPAVWAVAIALIGYLAYQTHETNLPTLPVAVQFRHALLGPGYVLILRNNSAQPLQVMASLTHPAINDTRSFDVYIAANGSTDISKLNGWMTQSGDRITLKNSHYQTWSGAIP